MASDPDTRAQRLRTLTEVRAGVLAIDERTASAYAQRAAGSIASGRKPRVHDTGSAATALVNDAEVWAQDADFSDFAAAVPMVRV